MSRAGTYDHLDPVSMPLDLDALADLLVRNNYGEHRFLSALVRARKRAGIFKDKPEDDQLMRKIERLLNEGKY